MVSTKATAYDIEVSNSQGIHIFYNYINDGQDLEVVNGWDYYSADVVGLDIPEEVTYMNRKRKVTSIGTSAFYYCNNLTFVNLPNSITKIGARAFIECTKLSYIAIPNSVTSIEEEAFRDCEKLASVDIGSGVYFIGPKAFYGCKKLTSVVIPEGVSSINNSIFYKCKELTSVTIPNSVTLIGEAAFEECTALSSITIPNNVTSIGVSAFKNCSRLTSISLPRSITSIGNNAFEGINISTIISKIKVPFAITGKASDNRTFSKNTFNNATLYVPVGTINKYKAKDGWKDFLFIEENPDPSDDGDIVINEVNFPDKNFRAYLMSQSYGQDGIITEEEIKNVVQISVGNNNITNLKGIEYFTALTYLFCNDNQLTSLDVSKNMALTRLSCGDNQVTSLDVSKNTALTSLICYRNQLTSLDVSKNTALTILFCDGNQLTSLDVSKNTTLTLLMCSDIQLTSLDVSKNTALTSLSCHGNQLTSLDVSKNTALTYLSCYDNKIKGEAMDNLVSTLPIQNQANLYVIRPSSTIEGNICTKDQVNIAKGKGWRVLTSSEEDYEGSDPAGIQGITLDKNVKTSIYDLNGRILKKPSKGINIIGGKKVLNH